MTVASSAGSEGRGIMDLSPTNGGTAALTNRAAGSASHLTRDRALHYASTGIRKTAS